MRTQRLRLSRIGPINLQVRIARVIVSRLVAECTDVPHELASPLNLVHDSNPVTAVTHAHQRESFCVKALVGASPVVCPCIAEWGLSRQRVIGLVRRRAGLPMMSVEISVCLYAA